MERSSKYYVFNILPGVLSCDHKTLLSQVQEHKDDLLSYVMFLRMTPVLPNWFINLASPHVGVPVMTFFWSTFFGKLLVTIQRVYFEDKL